MTERNQERLAAALTATLPKLADPEVSLAWQKDEQGRVVVCLFHGDQEEQYVVNLDRR